MAGIKVYIHTFGCKVNQYESQLILENFLSSGASRVNDASLADVCIVNTCAVTNKAERECRQLVRSLARKNKNGNIFITGCYATREPSAFTGASPRIKTYSNTEKHIIGNCGSFPVKKGISFFSERNRAFLKVQDGCNAHCSYCIIPSVRPMLWSKPQDEALQEAENLIANGYKEIVMTGIRLGLYRSGDSCLLSLLEKITSIKGHFRIRLSSLEINEVNDGLLELMRKESKLCRHLHIPLQSGDDGVLKDMNRAYSVKYFLEKTAKIRSHLPDCAITSDIIAGYPTESGKRFENTLETLNTARFSGVHIFRFSPRPGTKAWELPPLPEREVRRRSQALFECADKLKTAFFESLRGSLREVLPETGGYGWTDNYIRVKVPPEHAGSGLVCLPIC